MKILLVDDSQSSRELTAAYLREMGHPAIEAVDGPSALELYQRELPDLALLDVEMPGMDGYALAREIRRQDQGKHWVPIIFLSGRVGDNDVARGIEAGGDDYVTKPVSPTVLRAKLNAMARITEMRGRLLETSHELEDANRALMRLSAVDGLTNIANRRAFDNALEAAWRQGQQNGTPVALLLGDVDFFKRYNDSFGHQQGDACLQAVAGALARTSRSNSDLVARYGGEEFAVLLPETPAPAALEVAQRALCAIRELLLPHPASDAAPNVTLSLGVAVCVPAPSRPKEALIKAADNALYQAKAECRNRAAYAPVTA